ncbi:MAG: sulfatase-like hydrolase/transferase [Saprospiraceae bacterium]|nr:sulfatase-like hydrolase/transferase [Saprospiraceae bacterium]
MKKVWLWVALTAFITLSGCTENKNFDGDPPNVILILADDLGYGELGAYGQERIETPNLDELAAAGRKFSRFYTSSPVCAPARYALLTGQHTAQAFIRGNNEWASRGPVWDYRAMVNDSTLEGQYPMPDTMMTLPRAFKSIGYRTAMFGKWGLGAPHTSSIPTKMGFDYFYGYNCQRIAHTLYPVHMYENERRVLLGNDTLPPHTALAKGADSTDLSLYAPFQDSVYAPTATFAALQSFLRKQEGADEPFFMYWATPIPHLPLQAPQRWIDYYREKFGPEEPYPGRSGYFPTPYTRATYAAMITYLDEMVGALVEQLKEAGEYENTLILFTSDNGPTFTGGADTQHFKSGGPFRSDRGYGKGFVREGGIRVPLIASWPAQIPAGSQSHTVAVQYDLMATFSDLLGYDLPPTNLGHSFLPALLGTEMEYDQSVQEDKIWYFPEYGGQVAIRQGPWKLIRDNIRNPDRSALYLYNMETDSLEEANLLLEEPDIARRADSLFQALYQPPSTKRFMLPNLEDGLIWAENK